METVLAYIAAGIPKVGRKSLLKQCFIKTHITENNYRASQIELGMYEGIEDFIMWVNDLGFSDDMELTGFMKMEMDEKCKILAKLLDDISKNQEILLIEDKGCIITHDGKMCEWFLHTIELMQEKNRTVLGIASKFRLGLPIRSEQIYVMNVSPLKKMECSGLLQKYLEVEEISLSREQFKNYSLMLKGFPEQVKYACSLISQYGPERAYDFSSEIENYDAEIISQVLKEIEEVEENIHFLRFLAEIDTFSYQSLQAILNDKEFVKEKVNKFYINGIIEFVGIANEYIKINGSIKDYITRAEYVLSDSYKEKLNKYMVNFLDGYKYEELDMPDYLLKLKEDLKKNGNIDNKYMIPSQYLKTMVE